MISFRGIMVPSPHHITTSLLLSDYSATIHHHLRQFPAMVHHNHFLIIVVVAITTTIAITIHIRNIIPKIKTHAIEQICMWIQLTQPEQNNSSSTYPGLPDPSLSVHITEARWYSGLIGSVFIGWRSRACTLHRKEIKWIKPKEANHLKIIVLWKFTNLKWWGFVHPAR